MTAATVAMAKPSSVTDRQMPHQSFQSHSGVSSDCTCSGCGRREETVDRAHTASLDTVSRPGREFGCSANDLDSDPAGCWYVEAPPKPLEEAMTITDATPDLTSAAPRPGQPIVLRGGTVVTMDDAKTVLDEGDVLI